MPPPGPLRFVRPGTAMWLVLAALVVMVLPIEPGVRVGLEMVLWSAFIAVIVYLWSFVRSLRTESNRLDQVEDLLAMKRYMEVGIELEQIMSGPMRIDQHRLRAMVLLATTLARCGRFEDALAIYNQLVEVERVAGPSGAMVKMGRAMAMLQTDHLYDADRAINDLRRLIDRGGAGEELQQLEPDAPVIPPDALSISALRLVELYRDVKTGHADEAIKLFESNLPLMTTGLGHRVGEAYALVAVAYDRLGNTDAARARFLDGTALQGVGDILNRYPEVRPLITKYAPTPVPALP
jgi:tetratricopeptide (TPR) repeat protein